MKYLFSCCTLSGKMLVFAKLYLHASGVLRRQADLGLGPWTKPQPSFKFQITLELTQ